MKEYSIKFFSEIHPGQLVLRDPVTAITNVMIFLAGWWCWKQIRHSADPAAGYWKRFFLFIGLSSLIGVIVHGFSFYTPLRMHFWIWILMSIVQNLAVSFAQAGTARQYFHGQSRWINVLIVLQFIGASTAQIITGDYKWAKWHIAAGLLPVMFWHFYQWWKGQAEARWIAIGIAVSGITVAVHSFKISISLQWFNFNDIAHLLIIASLLIMIRGVRTSNNTIR